MSEDVESEKAPELNEPKRLKEQKEKKKSRIKETREIKDVDGAVRKCSKGERRCRACAKQADHIHVPPHITCSYCGSIHGFFRIRTGKVAREKIYLVNQKGDYIPTYNKFGDFVGNLWEYGDKMYDKNGEPIPEIKRVTACSDDSCKFYKIPIEEMAKYERTGNLDRV